MRARKRWTRILLLLALLAILLGVGVRTLLKADPGWYQPVVIDAQTQAQGQQQVQDEIADLRNRVGKIQVQSNAAWPTFDVEFTETQINGMISRWRDWPPLGEALGKVTEPHIRFLKNRAVIAGRTGEDGMLISIELSVTQTPTGPQVHLGRPWAGRLPLSRSLLGSVDGEIEARLKGTDVPEETLDSLRRLLAGETFAPIVAVPSNVVGRREFLPAKVEKLTIENGTLKATLRPFDPAHPGR